VVFVTTRNAHD